MKSMIFIIIMLISINCGPKHRLQNVPPSQIQKYFDRYNAEGAFVIQKNDGSDRFIYDSLRAKTGFLPASTFKIFSSLLALDSGVIGIDDTIPWDGIKRPFASWNQDQRMREAFQRSTVWFYQILVKRIGKERIKAAIIKNNYGNKDIGGKIGEFWLNGNLRISALEQIEFLKKLKNRNLSFSKTTMQQVEDLLLLKSCKDLMVRGKTGWTVQNGNQIGWFVGWIERKKETLYYAMNLESNDKKFPMPKARKDIVYGILSEFNLDISDCKDL